MSRYASFRKVAPRFRQYPEYKDAGVEWLAEIPKHWTVKPLKRIGSLKGGAGFPEDEQGILSESLPFFKVGDMGAIGNERQMTNFSNTISAATARRLRAFVFPPQTIVFAKVGAALLLNRRRLLVRDSCPDNNMMGFMPEGCDPNWAYYWMRGLDLREFANPGAVPSISEGQMQNISVVVPPREEQQGIAAFLDREIAKIDALVTKKERLTELLQERRASITTRAVTKGLDPNMLMKHSGLEWLGAIPDHWNLRPLTQLAIRITYGFTNPMPVANDGPYMLTANDIGDGVVLWAQARRTTEAAFRCDLTDKSRPVAKDILVTKDGTLGRVAMTDGRPACVNQSVALLRIKPEAASADFVQFALRAQAYQERIVFEAGGTAIKHLYISRLAKMPIALPPKEEQRRICGFISEHRRKADIAIHTVLEAIDRLKELRIALISAAVTGKIDVRGEVP